MRLAISRARSLRSYGLQKDDLVSEGIVGLLEAARFDVCKGIRFAAYASWWIKSTTMDFVLRNWSIVRTAMSADQSRLFFKLRQLKARLLRDPSVDPAAVRTAIAAAVGVPVREVEIMEARLSGDVCLNAPAPWDEDGEAEHPHDLHGDAEGGRRARHCRVSLAPTRWVIELGAAAWPTDLYLHVFEDDGEDQGHMWLRDVTRALRFASQDDAERFGSTHLDSDFAARSRPVHELVGHADHDPEDGRIAFRWKDYRAGSKAKVMTLAADEFIRRFLLHVLPKAFRRIRHLGFMANGRRSIKIAKVRAALQVPPPEPVPEPADYRERYARLTGSRIDVCPGCGGAMRERWTWP